MNQRRPAGGRRSAAWRGRGDLRQVGLEDGLPLSGSSALVASSKIRSRGRGSRARAMARRCRCPAREVAGPLLSRGVRGERGAGRRLVGAAMRAAAITSSRAASGRVAAMFSSARLAPWWAGTAFTSKRRERPWPSATLSRSPARHPATARARAPAGRPLPPPFPEPGRRAGRPRSRSSGRPGPAAFRPPGGRAGPGDGAQRHRRGHRPEAPRGHRWARRRLPGEPPEGERPRSTPRAGAGSPDPASGRQGRGRCGRRSCGARRGAGPPASGRL